jgi:hypothetical protein
MKQYIPFFSSLFKQRLAEVLPEQSTAASRGPNPFPLQAHPPPLSHTDSDSNSQTQDSDSRLKTQDSRLKTQTPRLRLPTRQMGSASPRL